MLLHANRPALSKHHGDSSIDDAVVGKLNALNGHSVIELERHFVAMIFALEPRDETARGIIANRIVNNAEHSGLWGVRSLAEVLVCDHTE
jgi:hypothetical protein